MMTEYTVMTASPPATRGYRRRWDGTGRRSDQFERARRKEARLRDRASRGPPLGAPPASASSALPTAGWRRSREEAPPAAADRGRPGSRAAARLCRRESRHPRSGSASRPARPRPRTDGRLRYRPKSVRAQARSPARKSSRSARRRSLTGSESEASSPPLCAHFSPTRAGAMHAVLNMETSQIAGYLDGSALRRRRGRGPDPDRRPVADRGDELVDTTPRASRTSRGRIAGGEDQVRHARLARAVRTDAGWIGPARGIVDLAADAAEAEQ